MGLLPTLGWEYSEREVTDTFAGYNRNLKIGDGEFFHTENLTSAYYPLLANRKKRGRVSGLTAPQGLLAKEKLAYVDNGTLYYDGAATPVTGLSGGEKQLVSMGAYIVVFPDKVFYNTADSTDYGSMEATYTSTGVVKYTMCRLDGSDYNTPTVDVDPPASPANGDIWIDTSGATHIVKQWVSVSVEWIEIPTVYTKVEFISYGEVPGLFKEFDGVTISGSDVDEVNGDKIIYSIGGDTNTKDYIVVVGLLETAVTQSTGYVKLERKVPELDYVVECQNRLWGCKYGIADGKNLNEIYCCTLGDFKNWRQYMGLSTDSWAASVGSDGPWTGAINYLGHPMFFKENRIHRVSVSSAGAHQITETVCRGVQEGSSKSLQVVNETLIYKSRSDVCAYQGSFPQSISEALGELPFYDAVAGAIGDRYYISMRDGSDAWHLFTFDIKRGIWLREDGLHAKAFARYGDDLYCITNDNALFTMLGSEGTLEPYVSWQAETGLMYYQYPDRKYVQRYNLRLFMEEGAEVDVYLQYDSSGEWIRQGRIKMKGTRTVTLPIRPRRCDHLRMKIVGKGEVRLYSIARILTIGSDVG
ncbi:MAG: hypothetical protein J5851_09015 [Oscillospiraceae bacterium]|nr:hypothetical protein [Oscillospiraceae bacterium]